MSQILPRPSDIRAPCVSTPLINCASSCSFDASASTNLLLQTEIIESTLHDSLQTVFQVMMLHGTILQAFRRPWKRRARGLSPLHKILLVFQRDSPVVFFIENLKLLADACGKVFEDGELVLR
eukprot:TRINITY_DN38147_c0_g1_i2.p1 TRINITY_DN38147_c0_g1~~TRINITY_DN38147_c0_g1_i2.p1  ORF type:complete len:123 (-),score=11.50 TRINITY_DN38147_c0_g1_i2:171-539(-)